MLGFHWLLPERGPRRHGRHVQAAVEGVASDRATFVTSMLPETGPGSMPSTEITCYKPTHRRSHARFLWRLVQQATEEMQWVSGSFHLQTKLRSQQPEPVLFDFRFAGLRR